ncbi:NAD(P)-dependent dehydrogenase (short-subunit alcohol dehydrogenase family) [Variovorax paradoxus]|jgi:NAD(P)-dependent dehydrogenase (short-subunit alcohol dehydrogenase family)|uniref:NAD(P)-dependent dehydrogenase (Short-subunit alcohol dehydrogenase family) n=1 Tax=Variovorax paradoxus TaxID=34073 RepID=A0AAE3XTH1_VARPD|nr:MULTISPECIES: SDR family oxidoreductase [Variovorax]MBD9666577.1 SDR family oxidoreductase [Variovorax sp. VRV01]MDP9966529.1 NAD(P)-dependent dehydrogenase (short-subunit alcohol dehydrogenase family) [Variovorax paradoxus]MDR6423927.1 NAD(P)-dependent dehydrogenase (short-subunit alcohol dehydrogenase family) [Variovorax paradoxus]MDR6452799.1 NAD(P)-dependent dehydrogenase (short-subunit alcohol dehydrogenase family) [Variovorax paradoxus]
MALEHQTVAVIGGSSGVGLETVRRLAAAGARVFAAGRDREKVRQATSGLGGSVSAHAFDACDRGALDAFFETTGPIDHLVLTLSGGEGAGEFAQLDLSSLRRGFEAKFWPQLEAAQAGLKVLRKGGSITFVTAISARNALPGTSGLAAINGALEAMVGSLARELGPSRVNAVSPGLVDTPWWNRMPAAAKDELFRQQVELLPVGRVGQPQDVAHAIEFLIGNGYTTGTVIECDGGLRLV